MRGAQLKILGVQPPGEFLYHSGSMNGLSADYLPPGFVACVMSIRYVIFALILLLPVAALLIPRLFRRSPREPRSLCVP